MSPLEIISPISSVSDLSAAAVSLAPLSEAPPNVVSNDPITAVRLLASLPANLGQNLDASA